MNDFAQRLHSFGANIVPVAVGAKKPVGDWKRWISQRQTQSDLESFDWKQADKLGIINGIGGWRSFDFDSSPDFFTITAVLAQLGLTEDYPWIERSISGNGWHVWVICTESTVPGFPTLADDVPGVFNGEIPTGGKLELRWHKNQTMVAGSFDPTKWKNGVPTTVPATVTGKQIASAFLAVAVPKKRTERPTDYVKGDESRPGDDFNARGDIRPVLEKHGWTLYDRTGEVEYWQRPGKKTPGPSATLNYYPGLFYVFSTEAPPFDDSTGYSLFAAYALLECDGDWKRASADLRAQGFGKLAGIDGLSDEQIAMLQGMSPVSGELKYRFTDYGNAEVFRDLYGTDFRFDRKRKDGWMHWNGNRWSDDERGFVEQAMLQMIRRRGQVAFGIADQAQRAEAMAWAQRCESGKHYFEALNRVKTMQGIVTVSTDYDTDPFLLTLSDQTLNLCTFETYAPQREDYISKQTNVTFDPEADCPLWDRFISDVFEGNEEIIRYVQCALGMCLSGDISEQAFFICHGQGANGKSTLLNTVRKVLGDYAATTSFSTFDADSRNEYGNDMAAIKGKRFIVAIEAEQNKKLAEARVKTITGGDSVNCRFLYGEFFEYYPTYKVWLSVNHKPQVRGADHGIWRRLHLIPFNVQFGDKPGMKPRIYDMESLLLRESAGIFNWLLAGFKMWREDGKLIKPAAIDAATHEYQSENDAVARFVEECCEESSKAVMESSDAYMAFRQWMESQGEMSRYIPNMTFWGNRMSEKGYTKVKNGRGRMEYRGIGLKELSFGGKQP